MLRGQKKSDLTDAEYLSKWISHKLPVNLVIKPVDTKALNDAGINHEALELLTAHPWNVPLKLSAMQFGTHPFQTFAQHLLRMPCYAEQEWNFCDEDKKGALVSTDSNAFESFDITLCSSVCGVRRKSRCAS
jgi:hypothetical protein